MKDKLANLILAALIIGALTILASCGKTTSPGAANNVTDLTIKSAPLAGPSAASLSRMFPTVAFRFFFEAVLESIAQAAVSSFKTFKACNDTLIFYDDKGQQISISGQQSSVGQGLLTFDPTSTSGMTLATVNIPAGTKISEVDVTFAVVPGVCSGAKYAVEFDPGTGVIDVTQNTAFKFKYSTSLSVTGSPQNITLLFGSIVNGMVALGSGLNDSTIQSINVGQAQ